jgi:hypothetical protein
VIGIESDNPLTFFNTNPIAGLIEVISISLLDAVFDANIIVPSEPIAKIIGIAGLFAVYIEGFLVSYMVLRVPF